MKKTTYLKTLLVAVCLLGGASFAWAGTTVVGATDNSDAAYYTEDHYKRYTLAPGKQIKIEFTVSTATDEQLSGGTWNPWYAWAVNFWDGTNNAITVEPRNYGWEDKTDNNRWTADWAKYWAQNYPSGWETGTNFRGIIQNATVVTTMKRVGSQVIIIYDITTEGGQKYRQYAVKEYGGGNNTITFDLVVSHTHITIDDDKTVTTNTDAATGTLIGNLNRCTGFTNGASHKEDFVIAPNGTLNLKFRNYSAGIETWQSWMFEMLYNGKYCNMVAGNNNQWGELRKEAGTFNNSANWPSNILVQMEGALVDLTVERSGAEVTVTAVHTPVSGDEFTLKYSFTSEEDGFATSDAHVHLISDYGYLDLLPVTKTITSAGWATYCSPYALDFTSSIANLTKAYLVTGNTGAKLDLSEITGNIPANTGILLEGEGDVNIPIVGSSSTDVSANKLVGKTAEFNLAAEGGYVLMASPKVPKVGFYKNTNAFTVGANTAYLPDGFGTGYARSFFSFDDEETTSVNELKTTNFTNNTNEVFDLQGRRVAQPTKGLYIVNGKKVVIK